MAPSPKSDLASHRPVSWTFSSVSEMTNPTHSIKTSAPSHGPHLSRPVTPVRAQPASTLIHSPSHSLLVLASGPPSPVPRDDIIEGMSASTSSIFERDVELLEPTLTAHDAIELAVPSVLDEAFEVLATTDPKHIIIDPSPIELQNHSSPLFDLPCTPPRKRLGLGWIGSDLGLGSEPSMSLGQASPSSPGNSWDRSSPSALPSSLPGLHHQLHSACDSMSISDLGSPRSLSPISTDGVGVGIGNQQRSPTKHEPNQYGILPPSPLQPFMTMTPETGHRRLASADTISSGSTNRLSFMSYADLINSERLADQVQHVTPFALTEPSPSVTSEKSQTLGKVETEGLGLALGEENKS
ncbi:hypothetical protein CROQUDRAFT_658463 [Cronartium quercuum f. sp. fusiforme G11]|uniref:Uncharacterized protein n=1 Tax=Cronartium quercuum f. sp. fusiforme G11 TaxID=708437 RepID=A0A9P6NGD5_9BASI|nr:hypothetical protein CROQUDRAFT_658463 [Cronartium quercuum f. sp. fusiforme G11]